MGRTLVSAWSMSPVASRRCQWTSGGRKKACPLAFSCLQVLAACIFKGLLWIPVIVLKPFCIPKYMFAATKHVHLSKVEPREVRVGGTGPWLPTFLLETCERWRREKDENMVQPQGHRQHSGEPKSERWLTEHMPHGQSKVTSIQSHCVLCGLITAPQRQLWYGWADHSKVRQDFLPASPWPHQVPLQALLCSWSVRDRHFHCPSWKMQIARYCTHLMGYSSLFPLFLWGMHRSSQTRCALGGSDVAEQ